MADCGSSGSRIVLGITSESVAIMMTDRRRSANLQAVLPADIPEETTCAWFVLGVWLFLTMVALGFVTFYGNRTPRWEDWFLVPAVTGAQPVDLAWLWENVQGHRIPILKLVLLACYSLFGFNSKPILYLNVLLFSALSLGLLWAIREVRGRWCYGDGFFPIVLLNLGQTEAFSWAQTFLYVASTCLATLVLVVIVISHRALNRSGLILVAVSLVVLPFTFGGGLVFAALMIPWFVYQGWVVPRTMEPSQSFARTVTLASAGIIVIITGLYFIRYQAYNSAPEQLYVKPGLVVYARTALKYLTSAFGAGAHLPWWQLPGTLITVILITTSLCLFLILARCRLSDNPRAVGLASYMISWMGITWVVGMGRHAWGDVMLDSRYAATSVAVLIGSYFVWEIHGLRALIPLGRIFLFTIATAFLAANLQQGVRQGVMQRDAERAFLQDLRAALPIPQLVAHHAWVTYYYHDRLEGYLRQLRDAGIAPYDQLPTDSSFQVYALSSEPAFAHQIEWDGHDGKVLGPDAYLQFDLVKPELISGLRFRFSLIDPSGMMPTMKVRWYNETKAEFQQYTCHYESTTGQETEVIVYIDSTISKVLILPNNRASTFRMSRIELLLPPGR
jgi:hypothetical protein